jgi:muconolactone delta-isomerase
MSKECQSLYGDIRKTLEKWDSMSADQKEKIKAKEAQSVFTLLSKFGMFFIQWTN